MGDFDLEDLNAWLLNSQVRHLNVKSVEVDTIETLVDSGSQSAFAHFVDSSCVVQGTHLVELTVQLIELPDRTRVTHKHVPETARLRSVASLEFVDNLVEVPRECQHVCMFLLGELGVDTKSFVLVSDIDLGLLVILGDYCSVGEFTSSDLGHHNLLHFGSSHEQSLLNRS